MRAGCRVIGFVMFAFVAFGGSAAQAQNLSWGDLSVSAGRMEFDLSGTGHAPTVAVRATRDLSSRVRFEFGGVFAKPEQQFGSSTLFMPEVQLQYGWNAGRFAPYVGGGAGTALVTSDFHRDWDPTYSFGGGTTAWFTERLGAKGDFRLRLHEWRATGTSSEISGGLVWRLPAF